MLLIRPVGLLPGLAGASEAALLAPLIGRRLGLGAPLLLPLALACPLVGIRRWLLLTRPLRGVLRLHRRSARGWAPMLSAWLRCLPWLLASAALGLLTRLWLTRLC